MKEYNLKINGNDYVVAIEVREGDSAKVKVNGTTYKVEMESTSNAKAVRPQVAAVPASHPVQTPATPANVASKPAAVSAGESAVLSPLPGVIISVNVAVGDTVAVGQTLLVLEAMKMENNIDSTFAGVVKSIKVNSGSSVMEGDVLITIG